MTGEFNIGEFEDVLWSITETCNLKCIYCSVAGSSCRPAKDPSKIEVCKVLEQLRLLPNLKSLILSGGEAMLTSNFAYVLSNASSLCSNVFVITNGVELPSSASRLLIRYRPTVMISIDSVDEDINKHTRGSGILDKSLQTLKVLKSMEIETVVISVVTQLNVDQYEKYLVFLYNIGIRNILLQQLHCEGRADRSLYKQLSPRPEQIDALYATIKRFKKSHQDIKIDYNEICFFPMREKAYVEKCAIELKYKPQRLFMCGAGFNFFAINTNGDVIPCNALRACVLGNILRENIVDILKSSDEALNIRKLRSLRVNSIKGCEDCTYSPVCDGGCRADVLHLTGDILSKHPYCNRKLTRSYRSLCENSNGN